LQNVRVVHAPAGIKDIDELVNTFVNAEDQNYTLFNYVNEVNSEIEKLEDQITAIKAEIERFRGEVRAHLRTCAQ
jgi:coiled-coil domain-containing protein 63/114